MTNEQARDFASKWINNFNARDVDAILTHFAENAEFTSPRALAITGRATLSSRQELGEYWRKALSAVKSIRFSIDHVINDVPAGRVVIVYRSEIDGRKMRAAEFFEFNNSMKVIRGEAMYGAQAG